MNEYQLKEKQINDIINAYMSGAEVKRVGVNIIIDYNEELTDYEKYLINIEYHEKRV